MATSSNGWFLYAAGPSEVGTRGRLIREDFEIGGITSEEVLVEPIYGCWEGNMEHSISRRPVDVCRQRDEDRVVIGNAGVVRIVEVGADVENLRPGQNGVVFSSSVIDSFGYPEKMLAYDAPNTMGCLATRIKLKGRELVPVPENTRYSLAQWAAFSVRYITAWSNWELAYGTFRLLIGEDELPSPHVWGWGGGTTMAELDLARRQGCQTVMLSGNDERLERIRKTGVTAVDRREFGEALLFDEKRFSEDTDYRLAYAKAERAFLQDVSNRTDGNKVQIFMDYIGLPVFRATSKALSRQGIITTAGWKEGMNITYLRAVECIGRHQLIHTHYARYSQAVAAVEFGEEHGWMPEVDERIYSFDEVPELADKFSKGEVGFFPVYSINQN